MPGTVGTGLGGEGRVTARASPRRRCAGSTSIAVSPAQPAATATRPIAIAWPGARTEANACHGAEVSTRMATGGRPSCPR